MYPQINSQGRSGDSLVTWQYLPPYYFSWDMSHVVPTLYQTFPRAEEENPPPRMLLKPNRINSSLLLHYLPLKQRLCSPAAPNCQSHV